MSLPLHRDAINQQPRRGTEGHAGLWFDKFCDQWRVSGSRWDLKGDDRNNPKLEWIKSVTGVVGSTRLPGESAMRLAAMVESRGGRWEVLATVSRFVTGLGRSHPVQNGFAWHPTLGTPYLPGSSVKGLVRAWVTLDTDPKPDRQTIERLLGGSDTAGTICFLDAFPIAPVRLEADVMTPHYAGWTTDDPPGDWCSPTPIPFLVTAPKTPLLFGLVPRGMASASDLDTVRGWLKCALAWSGAGAKTAVGYGRFTDATDSTEELRKRFGDRQRAREERIRKEQEAAERARTMATLTPVEREIEKILDRRQDTNMSDIIVVMQHVRGDRWNGATKLEVAAWLQRRMRREQRWKEHSGRKNPRKDRDYQRTLEIKRWLSGN